MKKLDLILLIVAAFITVFVATMCFFFYKFQAIPDTLCTCVLGTGTAELVVSALIQIKKNKKEENNEDSR